MKTLFILAGMLTVIFLAAPTGAEAQKSKTAVRIIEGIISGYECGDNCYLTITDKNGKEHSGLCAAPVCSKWNENTVMPESEKGRRVRATIGKGNRYDGSGNFVDKYPAFIKILFLPTSPSVSTTPPDKTGNKRPPISAEISWVKTNFPAENHLCCLSINSSGQLFAGTDRGIFRSTDNGATWKQIYNDPGIFSLTVNSSGHIFAAINDEIYRSTDNGDSWTRLKTFGQSNGAYILAVNSGGQIFAGAGGGIYRSTDNGLNWISRSNGLIPENFEMNLVQAIDFAPNGNVYAGSFDGVYRSTDNGDTWTPKLTFGSSNNAFVLTVSPNGTIFTSIFSNQPNSTGAEGIYRSTNNGDKWTRVNKTEADDIAINSDGDIFLARYDGVYRSVNNGTVWTKVSKTLKQVSVLTIGSNGTIFAGTADGIYRSN